MCVCVCGWVGVCGWVCNYLSTIQKSYNNQNSPLLNIIVVLVRRQVCNCPPGSVGDPGPKGETGGQGPECI